jgi:murein DD-endopeptidase MepM/ murein hydrolase activator NlpD
MTAPAVQSATGKDYPLLTQTITQPYHVPNSRYAAGYHTGVDYAAAVGSPVFSATSGVVKQVLDTGRTGYGKQVVVKDDDGTYTLYGHLAAIGVHKGDQLGAGTQIAQSGNTGNSTGAHLHFEVRSENKYGSDIDPVRWLTMPTTATTHAGTVQAAGYHAQQTDTIQAPGPNQGNGSSGIFDFGTGFSDFIAIITDGQFWIRVLEIAFGILLLMFGTYIFINGSANPIAAAALLKGKLK